VKQSQSCKSKYFIICGL